MILEYDQIEFAASTLKKVVSSAQKTGKISKADIESLQKIVNMLSKHEENIAGFTIQDVIACAKEMEVELTEEQTSDAFDLMFKVFDDEHEMDDDIIEFCINEVLS